MSNDMNSTCHSRCCIGFDHRKEVYGEMVFLVSWPKQVDSSFLHGAFNFIFVGRAVGVERESEVIPF